MHDLLTFIAVLAVFVLAYAVSIRALKFPNVSPSWSLIINIIYEPYWTTFGELFEHDGNGTLLWIIFNSIDDLIRLTHNLIIIILLQSLMETLLKTVPTMRHSTVVILTHTLDVLKTRGWLWCCWHSIYWWQTSSCWISLLPCSRAYDFKKSGHWQYIKEHFLCVCYV